MVESYLPDRDGAPQENAPPSFETEAEELFYKLDVLKADIEAVKRQLAMIARLQETLFKRLPDRDMEPAP